MESIRLYRGLLRAGKSMKDYNFRNYVVRRTREEFQRHRGASGEELETLLEKGRESLELVQRQALICNLYATNVPPSVMDAMDPIAAHQDHMSSQGEDLSGRRRPIRTRAKDDPHLDPIYPERG